MNRPLPASGREPSEPHDFGAFTPTLQLRPSALFVAGLLVLVLAALCAAATSERAWPQLAVLLTVMFALLAWSAWQEGRHGLRTLRVESNPAVNPEESSGGVVFTLAFADGRHRRLRYAGFAWLGSVAVLLFFQRDGARRWLGPQRVLVMRDAVTADEFRRLRAWVRLR